jgi:uncharacterized membrane protein
MNWVNSFFAQTKPKSTKLEEIIISKDEDGLIGGATPKPTSTSWFSNSKPEEIEVKKEKTWFSNFSDQITTLKKKITEEEEEKTWFTNFRDTCEGYITLTAKQRMLGFTICFGFAILNFVLAFFCLYLILVTARLFTLFYTLGVSSLFLSSMFFVGPFRQIQSMFTWNRIIPSIIFLGSLLLTLYFSLMMQSLAIVFFLIFVQIISFSWYILTYIPYGEQMIGMLWNTFTNLF